MAEIEVKNSNIGAVVSGDAIFNGDMYFNQSPTGKPLQRPARVEYFTGREVNLKKLLNDLQPGRIVTLCGPGGIGKTALSSAAVWELAPGNEAPERFPDGVVFYSFYGKPNMDLAYEHIVRSFDRDARDNSQDAARRTLAAKQVLLILDGAEEAKDLRKVLEICDRCGVLITSRTTDDAPGDWQDISPLPLTSSVELLQAIAGKQAEDAEAAREICEITGGLPLAVRLVGYYLSRRRQSAGSYLEWLKDTPLDALDQKGLPERNLLLIMERSITQVSQDAQHAMALNGLLALAPFSGEVVASVFDIKGYKAEAILGELVAYGLLIRPEARYEISHPLIHTYVREHLKINDKNKERLVSYFIALVIDQSTKGPEGYARLDADRFHFMRVLIGCKEREEWESVLQIAWATQDYLDMQGHWVNRITFLKAGVEAAERLKNRSDEGDMNGNLGIAYNDLGQVEKAIAYNKKALKISREIGDSEGEANRLGALGIAYSDVGMIDKAIEHHEKAVEISREIGDRRGEGSHLGNLGSAYLLYGQVKKAIECSTKALLLSRKTEHREAEGQQLGTLGIAYSNLGRIEEAIEYYKEALFISREIGDRRGEGIQLGNLGLTYRDLGQKEMAVQYTKQALSRFEEIKSPYAETVKNNLKKLEKE